MKRKWILRIRVCTAKATVLDDEKREWFAFAVCRMSTLDPFVEKVEIIMPVEISDYGEAYT